MISKTGHRQGCRPYKRTLVLVASRHIPQSFLAQVFSDYVQGFMPDRECVLCYGIETGIA